MYGVKAKLKGVIKITKPAVVTLLAFTAIASAIVAYGSITVFFYMPFVLALISVVTGAAGAEAVTAYTDRDIDRIMERTNKRPVPSGTISGVTALIVGLVLISTSIIFAVAVSLLVTVLILIALVDNIVVYSLWLKRSSRWNIVLGGICGGIPVLMGWASVTGSLSWASLFLAMLVIVWIPIHIWSFSIEYMEDYQKASIPMFPLTIKTVKKSMVCVGMAGMVIAIFPILAYFAGIGSYLFLAISTLMGLITIALSISLIMKPAKKNAKHLFIFSNIYLFIVFVALIIPFLRY